MEIKIQFITNSVPIIFNSVEDVYTKDCALCILFKDGTVRKYPMTNIWYWESKYNYE